MKKIETIVKVKAAQELLDSIIDDLNAEDPEEGKSEAILKENTKEDCDGGCERCD